MSAIQHDITSLICGTHSEKVALAGKINEDVQRAQKKFGYECTYQVSSFDRGSCAMQMQRLTSLQIMTSSLIKAVAEVEAAVVAVLGRKVSVERMRAAHEHHQNAAAALSQQGAAAVPGGEAAEVQGISDADDHGNILKTAGAGDICIRLLMVQEPRLDLHLLTFRGISRMHA